MDSTQQNGCAAPLLDTLPRFAGIKAPDGLEVWDHLFLLSLLPCCAQLALPYWAKVTGNIANRRSHDLTAVVSVALLDDRQEVVERYSDMVLLDPGESSNFEVKLVESRHKTAGYRIEIDMAEAP